MSLWQQPFAEPGFAFGGNSGVFAESADRILIAMRGETRLPSPLPTAYRGFAGSIGINVLTKTDLRVWRNCLYSVDRAGKVKERWPQWDSLCDGSNGPGPHRVRISPYDSQKRRHTSFASLDVIPMLEEADEDDIEISPDDLRIDVYRSSGPGGQSVNTTDSAVRITHIPTGIVAACQNERSQLQNRAVAMRILKARLAERERVKREEEMASIRGERKAVDFGSQIRSYVLAPYQMVKDHRTDVEIGDPQRVLDGDLDRFTEAELRRRAAESN